MDIAAFYFPNFHRTPLNEAWYGEGWTEWQLVKSAKPRFDGHYQPLVPEWGYFDESDPAWAAKEIDLAADHGVNVFLHDWYWYSGVQMLHEQLEQGFLRAPNRQRMKFALMWANHTWSDLFPIKPRTDNGSANVWLPVRHTLNDLQRVAEYCVKHYFREPNYWTIDGHLYFSFFSYHALAHDLGGEQGVADGLGIMNDVVRKAGLPPIHFAVNIANVDVGTLAWDPSLIAQARRAGFHSVFGYNIARPQNFAQVPIDWPLVEYADVIESHEYLWNECDGRELEFFPVVTVGSDASPRWHPSVRLPLDFRGFPYESIVINNTPRQFGVLCEKARRFIEQRHRKPIVFVNAWNEWTEGNVLLPEARYGSAYLRAIRDAFYGASPDDKHTLHAVASR